MTFSALSLVSSLFFLLFFPQLPILFFSPYIAYTSLQNSIKNLLIRSMMVGAIVDLFSSHVFGFYMGSYLIGALGLSLHARFLVYNWSTLPLLTAVFAMYCSMGQCLYYSLRGNFFWLEPKYFLTEVMITSSYDALFAFALFLLHTGVNRTRAKVRK